MIRLLEPVLALVPPRVRRFVDNFWFWVGFFNVAIAALVVGLYFVNARTSRTLARQAAEASRLASEKQASADASYKVCIASIPQIARINVFLDGVQDLGTTLRDNSIASHAATPASTDLYRQQVKNIRKLRRAVRAVSGVKFPAPTPQICLDRKRLEQASPRN